MLAIGAGVLACNVLDSVVVPLAVRSIEAENSARSRAEEVRTFVAAEKREIKSC